jgi:hypothetical protein
LKKILAHPIATPKIIGVCCVVGEVVSVGHGMTLHPRSGLRFPPPKLGAFMMLKITEDRQVLLNIGVEGTILHQLMDFHPFVVIHVYESTRNI